MAAAELEQDFGLVANLVRLHAREHPNALALIKDERSLTYAQLDALIDRIAASLQRDVVVQGQSIAICAAAPIEYAAVILGDR